jgi:hypothetical protein
MRKHNVMPNNAQIRECLELWGFDRPNATLEELVKLLDDVVEDNYQFWNGDIDD